MVTLGMIQRVDLSPGEISMCERFARMMPDFKSNVSSKRRPEDQLVGQVANYAGLKQMYGKPMGVERYVSARHVANRWRKLGDMGEDMIGANLDFKGSLMRTDRGVLAHNLIIRPLERHDGWVYVLVLIEPTFEEAQVVGWAADHELPDLPEKKGIFRGAYVIPARHLHPMKPLRFFHS